LLATAVLALAISKAQVNPCQKTGMPYSSLPGDTTIRLPHGTLLTFNRCEYFDIKDCLELSEAYDIESIRRQNLTTLDRNGNVLLSAGMFCMRFTGDCNSKPCFEVPVKARMPLPSPTGDSCSTCERGTFMLYNSRDGFWSDSSNNNFRIIDSASRSWIEFTIYCGNICYNGDCRMGLAKGKTKVKVKKISRLDKVEIITQCPLGVLKYFPERGKKKVIARLPCIETSNVKILASGYDKDGNTVTSAELEIKELKHSRGKRKCNSRDEKMGRKTKKGGFYKRYIITL